MIIDETNISTFGLKLIAFDGYFSQPARKNILSQPAHAVGDIVFQSKTAEIALLGRYASSAALLSNLNAFLTLLKSQLKHTIELVSHEETFTGVFDKGYEVTSYNGGKIVKITTSVTVVE